MIGCWMSTMMAKKGMVEETGEELMLQMLES